MSRYTITTIQPDHFAALEELQRIAYPTLGEQELMRVEHFASQYAVFAEGQIVVLDGDRVIGQGSGFFTDFDFEDHAHTFAEICDNFYFRTHDPDGAYYYGADISVHPDYRGRGIGKMIYKARKNVVRRYNRRGIVAGGVLPGYARYKQHMPRRRVRAPRRGRRTQGPDADLPVEAGICRAWPAPELPGGQRLGQLGDTHPLGEPGFRSQGRPKYGRIMTMNTATSTSRPIDYAQVIELVSNLPPERLRSAYDYLLFLAAQPVVPFPTEDLFDEPIEELRADEERWNRQFSELAQQLACPGA